MLYILYLFLYLHETGQVTYLFQKPENIHPENEYKFRNGNYYFCYPLVTRSDSTVLTRTTLRWSEKLCPHRVIVTTISTRPKRAWPFLLGLNFTGEHGILTDPWRPVWDAVMILCSGWFFGNTRNVQLVMRKSSGWHPFIKSPSQNGSLHYICA